MCVTATNTPHFHKNNYNMKQTILITGAGGNIGFETLKEFLKKKINITLKLST